MNYIKTVFAPYTGTQHYTYATTLDLVPGDFTAVQTPNGSYQIVKVLEVDLPKPKFKCKVAFQRIAIELLEESSVEEATGSKRL